MRDKERTALIQKIEKERGSRVIAYLTGDRKGMETKIAFDQPSLLYDHLNEIGPQEQIDLFLYSPGGLTLAGFAIANLIREFCKRFAVLIPLNALSAATLIALAADEIVMARPAQLSPVDPAVASPYNPPAPGPSPPGVVNLLPLSVEDVSGYISMAKEQFGIVKEDSLTKVLEFLASQVHPIALGSVLRSREQMPMLVRKLMKMHWPKEKAGDIDGIVETLTKELGSHDYRISRREARDEIKLPVVFPSLELEALMWELFKKYQKVMELTSPYNAQASLGNQPQKTIVLRRAFIESTTLTHVYETHRSLTGIQIPQQGVQVTGVQEITLTEEWKEYR